MRGCLNQLSMHRFSPLGTEMYIRPFSKKLHVLAQDLQRIMPLLTEISVFGHMQCLYFLRLTILNSAIHSMICQIHF